jgi:predicted ester cyclase
MAVDIKQAYRKLLEEAFGKGNLEVFDEICDRGYRGHDPVAGDGDLQKSKESCRMYRAAFPDLQPTVLGMFLDGDCVITHWRMTGTHQGALMGTAPTGNRCTCEGISLAKFRNGKLVEDWVQWDALGLFRQIGAAQSLQPGAGAGAGSAQKRPHA